MVKVFTKVIVGADHAGYHWKEDVKAWLHEWGYDLEDVGATEFDEADDYPDFMEQVAKKVAEDPQNYCGITLGGSGQGEQMVPNRNDKIRAGVYYGYDLGVIGLLRQHNNANILALGVRVIGKEFEGSRDGEERAKAKTKEAIKLFLETPFEGGRHKRRIDQFSSY